MGGEFPLEDERLFIYVLSMLFDMFRRACRTPDNYDSQSVIVNPGPSLSEEIFLMKGRWIFNPSLSGFWIENPEQS
jgi:hypothetical protein